MTDAEETTPDDVWGGPLPGGAPSPSASKRRPGRRWSASVATIVVLIAAFLVPKLLRPADSGGLMPSVTGAPPEFLAVPSDDSSSDGTPTSGNRPTPTPGKTPVRPTVGSTSPASPVPRSALPTGRAAPFSLIREAEDRNANIFSNVTVRSDGKASGGAVVTGLGQNSSLEMEKVEVNEPGDYLVQIWVASTAATKLYVRIDGVLHTFSVVPAPCCSTVVSFTVALNNSDGHSFIFGNQSGVVPEIDRMRVSR